jgi:hypothetical protein
VADEQLRGTEQYLDEVQSTPPRWRALLGVLVCLLTLAAVVVGAKIWLFPDLSVASLAIRSLLMGLLILGLWVAFFRRRMAGTR